MLFDDDDYAAAAYRRSSVVAPATRSESAERKARTKQTEDGLPVHSFRTLLADLGTLTLNHCVQPLISAKHELSLLSTPTPVQQRAFDLLGFSPRP